MSAREALTPSLVTGAGSAATAVFLDVTSLLDYALWEIALSFPLGAVVYFALWVLTDALPSKGGAK
jgi:hypothetical protein